MILNNLSRTTTDYDFMILYFLVSFYLEKIDMNVMSVLFTIDELL